MNRLTMTIALVALATTSVARAADAAHGKEVFLSQCGACHTATPGQNGFGPSLAGVVGSPAGTAPGFKYTDAISTSGLEWDPKTLDEFLTSSTKRVPGTAMDYSVSSAADRQAIIEYLATTGPARVAAGAGAAPIVPHGGPTQQDLLAAGSNPRDWLYATKDYEGDRFADLKQINVHNAASLRPVCIYRSDLAAPTQTNPLVYNGVMYLGVENSVVSIDAANCRQRWLYKWNPKGPSISLANRGVAIKDGVLVRGTSDGYLIALDMERGRLLWSKKIAEQKDGQYLSMPPLMFEDMVIYGPAGADFGPKNWVGAFKIATGEQVWRFNLIPDPGAPGSETWKDPQATQHGGGSLWTPLALDAKAGILYLPVGNPAPDFYGELRDGANLYTNSVVALDVHTGQLKWYKQFVPHDVHDSDLSQVSPLFTATIGGKTRNLISISGKDGRLRVMDRDTQEIYSDQPITTLKNVDANPTVEGIHRCPGLLGGVEWNGPAFNRQSKTLYVGANDWCGMFKLSSKAPTFQSAAHYYGGEVVPDDADKSSGWITAIDAVTGKVKWQRHWPTPFSAGIVATSGGVLFTGGHDFDFVVMDAANGKDLYRFNTGGSIGGGVLTYEVKGKQYVATMSGIISGFHGGSGTSAVVVLALP